MHWVTNEAWSSKDCRHYFSVLVLSFFLSLSRIFLSVVVIIIISFLFHSSLLLPFFHFYPSLFPLSFHTKLPALPLLDTPLGDSPSPFPLSSLHSLPLH